jgi:YVTN family beta-propeller protein
VEAPGIESSRLCPSIDRDRRRQIANARERRRRGRYLGGHGGRRTRAGRVGLQQLHQGARCGWTGGRAHQRAASERLPDVELGLFLLAGDRIVAARPADTRQFDISSNQILATITTNPDPRNIAFDGTYLWVSASASDVIMKVDPRTNSIIDTIQLPAGSGPYDVVFDGTHMWVDAQTPVPGLIYKYLVRFN